jgi:D-aminopeptidase
MDHLFDVTLSTYGDAETGEFKITAEVVGMYNFPGGVVGGQEFTGAGALDAAVEWAKGAVAAFMKGTKA